MVTTRRSSDIVNTYDNGTRGGVGLLERPSAYSAPAETAPKISETESQAKERMQKNLDKLLNYDRYSEQQVVDQAVAPVDESFADEDIRPTSTTMQFGDDIDQIREEMHQAAVVEEHSSYRLNNKGKLVMVLYAIAVTVILALIILNTGVLASLSDTASAKSAELNAAIEEYNAVQTQIENISSSDYIIDVAENDYGMIKK